MFFGRKSKKVWVFNAREETLISAFLWHAGRTKEELSRGHENVTFVEIW